MFKVLFISLLAIQCNCQKVIEITGRDVQTKGGVLGVQSGVSYSNALPVAKSFGSFGVGDVRYSGFGGGLQPVGVQKVAGVDLSGLSGLTSVGVRPVGFGVGYGSIGGLGAGGQNYGFSQVGASPVGYSSYGLGLGSIGGLRTDGLNYGVSQVGVRPVGYGSYGVGLGSIGGLRAGGLNYGVNQVGVGQYGVVSGLQPVVKSAIGVNAVGLGLGYGQRVGLSQQVVPVSAAIQNVGRTVEYRTHPYNDEPIVPQVVEVEPSDVPLRIHFKSRSSTIQLSQEHIPGQPGTVEHTQSQDEPSKVIHQVLKPVIQEVREVIQPYRQVVQEVQPVVESVHTVVAKGEGERRQALVQPFVKNYQSVQAVHAVQPAVAYQGVAQRFGVGQAIQKVSQPVFTQSFQKVAQPIVGFEALRSVGVSHQPQGVLAVSQPFASRFDVSQPAIVGGLGSGSFVSGGGFNSGLVGTRGALNGIIGSGVSGLRTIGTSNSYFTNSRTVPSSVTYQQRQSPFESDIDESDLIQN